MSRREKVAEFIKEEVSEILRKKVFDPRIGFATITGVDLSPDLKQAKIFVSIFGKEPEKQEALKGLSSAAGFIRSELGKSLEMRLLPNLAFVRDDSLERGSRVLNLLSKISNEKKTVKGPKKSSKKR